MREHDVITEKGLPTAIRDNKPTDLNALFNMYYLVHNIFNYLLHSDCVDSDENCDTITVKVENSHDDITESVTQGKWYPKDLKNYLEDVLTSIE